MTGFSLSYTRWSDWNKCPAAYNYKHNLKVKEPDSPALAAGRKTHDVVAKFVAGASDEMPKVLAKHFSRLGQALHDMPKEQKQIETKMGFDIEMRPCAYFGPNVAWRFGHDVFLTYEPRVARAVDWKTGRRYASYDDQQQLFALPAFWSDPKLEKFVGHWLYLDDGQDDEKTFTREQVLGPSGDPAKLEGLSGVWNHNWRLMAADRAFPAKPSDEACKWCNFSWRKNGPCREGM